MSFSAQPSRWQALRKLGLLGTWVSLALLFGAAHAKDAANPGLIAPITSSAPTSSSASVALASLPPEAQAMNRLIRAGGPFEHSKDASVFGNRERALPVHPRGYYREYTVATPQARNRGARRIVCGGTPPTAPQDCYYTGDHYATFQRIVP